LQAPRSLPVLRQELQRDQDLGDVVQGGAVGICSHFLPARGNGLDGSRLCRRVEIANSLGECIAIPNFTGLDLPGEVADEFQQIRKSIFEARDGRFHRRHAGIVHETEITSADRRLSKAAPVSQFIYTEDRRRTEKKRRRIQRRRSFVFASRESRISFL
jgi:hypothetical protein